MTSVNRRTFLRAALAGAGGAAVAVTSGCSMFTQRGPISTVGAVQFTRPLHIPPLAMASINQGLHTFSLTAQVGKSSLVSAGQADTWGINGALWGPTIRVRRGDQVQMRVTNNVPEATTLHWHGMRLPAAADGGPHQMIDPGAVWEPSWTIDQPAATLWYHPHPHGQTERHLLRGLGGVIIIDDDDPVGRELPADYGVDDVPMVLQDRTFDAAGQIVETDRKDVGMLGDQVMVNGTIGGYFEVTAQATRLRLLNASAARCYNVGFADDRAFDLIASDGGLLSAPVQVPRVQLSPGERAEIVVRLQEGERVVLRSYPQELGVTQRMADRTGGADQLDLLELRAADELTQSSALPSSLVAVERLDPATAAATRVFDLGNNRINNQVMDMMRIDAQVRPETVEVWQIQNVHTRPHNFHIHDVQFLVLDLNGQPPPPELAGWKDTIYTPPGVPIRLAMRFGANPDPQVPYMFHCHLLWHEDQGMMGQFVVSETPVAAPAMPSGGHQHP